MPLSRFVPPRRKVRAGHACEFCSEPLPAGHGHVVNLETRALMCACRACRLLFASEGAAQGRFRAVPDRYAVAEGALAPAHWEQLQLPVAMAFFFFNSALGRTVVLYPSPAGATESMLPLETAVETGITPDVEALLVRHSAGGLECYIVPIDACYELVGRIRKTWKGFDGGEEARGEIDGFFARVKARSAAACTI